MDVVEKSCQTLTGIYGLNEPGGLCVCDDGRTLLVADTNNHRIQKIDLLTHGSSHVSIEAFDTYSI